MADAFARYNFYFFEISNQTIYFIFIIKTKNESLRKCNLQSYFLSILALNGNQNVKS